MTKLPHILQKTTVQPCAHNLWVAQMVDSYQNATDTVKISGRGETPWSALSVLFGNIDNAIADEEIMITGDFGTLEVAVIGRARHV